MLPPPGRERSRRPAVAAAAICPAPMRSAAWRPRHSTRRYVTSWSGFLGGCSLHCGDAGVGGYLGIGPGARWHLEIAAVFVPHEIGQTAVVSRCAGRSRTADAKAAQRHLCICFLYTSDAADE